MVVLSPAAEMWYEEVADKSMIFSPLMSRVIFFADLIIVESEFGLLVARMLAPLKVEKQFI